MKPMHDSVMVVVQGVDPLIPKPTKSMIQAEQRLVRCLQEPAPGGNHFYKLLIEVLKIETNVLLNDVLRPDADATDDAAASAAAEARAAAAEVGIASAVIPSATAGADAAAAAVDSAASELGGMELDYSSAGPSAGAAGRSAAGASRDVAGPSDRAPHPDAPVFESPHQQEWVPGTQAQGWEAASRTAAAASGASVQLVRPIPLVTKGLKTLLKAGGLKVKSMRFARARRYKSTNAT